MRARLLFVTCSVILVFIVGVTRPLYNWDMVGYVASAYSADGYRGAELTKQTYGAIRGDVDNATFQRLTQDGTYEESVSRYSSALAQQLPFYSVRVAYVELMRALKPFGVSYTRATYLISACFAALSLILLDAILAAAGISFIAFPVIAIAAGFAHLARLSTPDALTCFFSLWATYCLLSKQRMVFVAAALLPLMRTDAVILSALITIYTFRQGQRLLSCLSLLGAVTSYVLINRWHGSYGLLGVFNFYFFTMSPFPAQMPISHHLADYLPPYLQNLRDLLVEPGPQTLIYLLALYAVIAHRDEARKFTGLHVLLTVPACFILMRLLAFPNYEERFFVFPASMILAGTIGILAKAAQSARTSETETA